MARDAFFQELGLDQSRIVKTQLYPDRWQNFCAQYKLTWNFTPFKRDLANQVSKLPGVYCFHIGHDLNCLPSIGLSLYGGSTERTLRTRFLEYFWERDSEKGRFWVRKFLLAFEGELSFGWSPVDTDKSKLKALEKELNAAMMPQYSRKDFDAEIIGKRNAWP